MVGAKSNRNAMLIQNIWRGDFQIPQFRFATVTENRAADNWHACSLNDVRNAVSLCTMYQNRIQMKFLCNPNGGHHIICTMTMKMCLVFSPQQWQQGFALCIIIRLIFSFFDCLPLFQIAFCFIQALSNNGSGCHSGKRHFISAMIDALRIFAQCKFNPAERQFHIIHAVSGSFQNQHRSAARICTARRCHNGGHASSQSLGKAAV